MEGSVLKYNKERGSFCKVVKEGGTLNQFKRERRGFGANLPFLFLLPPKQSRGGGSEVPAAMGPRPGGATAAGVEGERGSGVRGINSPAHLGLGRGEEAGQREQAAAALGGSGGGARELGENRHGVV